MATTTSSSQQTGPTTSSSLGIPIQMPADRAVSPQQRPLSNSGFRRHHAHEHSTSSIPSVSITAHGSSPSLKPDEKEKTGDGSKAERAAGSSTMTTTTTTGLLGVKRPNRSALGGGESSTSVNKIPGRNSQSAAQVVLLKRKRNQEPLDGLLLEMGSRYPSEHNLARGGVGGEEEEEQEQGIEERDVKPEGSVRARKRKRIASTRGFFQLAETVEKAKWDDDAWRRDFNERVLTKSKEGKKALAAAAGVEVVLDSPVVEKTQAAASASSSSIGQGMLSPTKETNIGAIANSKPRKYTVVLQSRPPTLGTRETVPPTKTAVPKTANDLVLPIADSVVNKTGKPKEAPVESKAESIESRSPISGGGGGSEGNVLYFDAVPYGSSEEDSSDSAKREEDEIAAFLPMLQDYLKLNDIPSGTNVTSDAKLKSSSKTQVNPKMNSVDDGTRARKREEVKGEEEDDDDDDDDEYVYDVYFKRSHEPTSTDWNNLGNYGTLVGLPPEMREDEDDSDGGFGDDSDYDIDDDSNDEGFYRNDYPDEDEEYSDEEESDDFYDDRDDSEEEEDYDDDRRWR